MCSRRAREVEIIPGESTNLFLAIPSEAGILTSACTQAELEQSTAVVIGFVRDAETDAPIEGATVAVTWSIFEQRGAGDVCGKPARPPGHFRFHRSLFRLRGPSGHYPPPQGHPPGPGNRRRFSYRPRRTGIPWSTSISPASCRLPLPQAQRGIQHLLQNEGLPEFRR